MTWIGQSKPGGVKLFILDTFLNLRYFLPGNYGKPLTRRETTAPAGEHLRHCIGGI
jgi:hypothetical protein